MSLVDDYIEKNPQYKDIPHDKVADALYNKFYAGKMSKEDFDGKVSVSRSGWEKTKDYVKDYGKGIGDASKKVPGAVKEDVKDAKANPTKFAIDAAGGTVKPLTNIVGGVAKDVSGAAVGDVTGDAKKADLVKKKIDSATGSVPSTHTQDAVGGVVGAVLKPAGDLLELFPKMAEEHGHPILADNIRVLIDLAGGEEALTKGAISKATAKEVAEKVGQGAGKVADAASKVKDTALQVHQDAKAGAAVRKAANQEKKIGDYTASDVVKGVFKKKVSAPAVAYGAGHLVAGPVGGAVLGGATAGTMKAIQYAKDAKAGKSARITAAAKKEADRAKMAKVRDAKKAKEQAAD